MKVQGQSTSADSGYPVNILTVPVGRNVTSVVCETGPVPVIGGGGMNTTWSRNQHGGTWRKGKDASFKNKHFVTLCDFETTLPDLYSNIFLLIYFFVFFTNIL